MKGDFTRFTHAPEKRYTAVLKQQGRVELDADLNEDAAIEDRLRRVTNTDVIGAAGAPENAAGFEILADGSAFIIDAGRMYVDGLLCELDQPTPYGVQPHLPLPHPLLDVDDEVLGRTDLVYLDVWQRHVTAVEDPDLLDPALDGLDTTTRVQTVWQVRVAQDIGDLTCAEALATLPHSAARLTTGAVAVPDPANPCDIVVAGGYRGIENRLYRVEIHDGGDQGVATWKWSRDNGAVLFAVEELLTAPDNRIRVRTTGRDRYLAVRQDDWIEIQDDASELGLEPGFMAQVTAVDEASRIVTLDRDVPAGMFAQERNPRVRRWDQVVDVDGDGLLLTEAGPVDLEDGVQVSFGGNAFRTGDWWAFAARTAEGTVEPLGNAPASGITHHYAALARIGWSEGEDGSPAVEVIEDCRTTFPPLTGICADDVCFDNGNCDLPGARTVQDAIDQLCEGRDLRWHNRHLHGWGIVCGLQVVCGPDGAERGRRSVTVRSGYALDCDGSDLILRAPVTVDLLDRIQALDRLDPNNPILVEGKGEVCLVLGRNGGGTNVEIERHVPTTGNVLEQALEDTLLKDFFDGCAKPVLDLLRDSFRDEDERLVGTGRKRLTSFLNLAVQVSSPAAGRHVWISREEDRFLREFHPKLRALLQSRTFCAMFQNARPLPEYPFDDVPLGTVFGKGSHTRLRARPGTPLAYTAGAGNTIHVFDMAKREMVAELEFPGGSGVAVQDLAFAPDGGQLFAVATLGNDTLFASADIRGANHTFNPVTVMRDVHIVTLVHAGGEAKTLLGIGRGRGLFEIDPARPSATPQPRAAFNAVGHMVVHEPTASVWATSRSEGTPDRYDRVERMALKGGANSTLALIDPQGNARTGNDDLMVTAAGARAFKLYVVTDGPTTNTKDILVFDATGSPNRAPGAARTIPVDGTAIRMAPLSATLAMLTAEAGNYAAILDTVNDRIVPDPKQQGMEYRIPVQVSPRAVVMSDRGEAWVLNIASNTISIIPATHFSPERAIDREVLARYRDGMLAAYTDLLAGMLQYLKDCLCDRLLVDCPECDEDDRVFLGCVSIRDGQVYRVCNFSKRRYVKSFPTVEYWLSLVPVLPIARLLIERFCCSILTDRFSRFEPASDATRPQRIAPMQLQNFALLARDLNVGKIAGAFGDRFDLLREFAGDWAGGRGVVTQPAKEGVRRDAVFGQSLPDVRTQLEGAGIGVAAVQPYNPADAVFDVVRPGGVPRNLAPGSNVVLYQDEAGVVRHWTIAAARTAPVGEVPLPDTRKIDEAMLALREAQSQLETARTEVGTLRTELSRIEEKSTAELEARDKQIAELRTANDTFRTQLRTIDRLSADIEQLKRRG